MGTREPGGVMVLPTRTSPNPSLRAGFPGFLAMPPLQSEKVGTREQPEEFIFHKCSLGPVTALFPPTGFLHEIRNDRKGNVVRHPILSHTIVKGMCPHMLI